jgi:hypothetical protein
MNTLRLIDDGRFSVKTASLAFAPIAALHAATALRQAARQSAPELRILPHHNANPVFSLYWATKTAQASSRWDDLVFTVLALGGLASILLALLEAL